MSEQLKLKKDFYQLRVLDIKDATSAKAGLPMKVLTLELINAAPITVEGRQVDVNGHIKFMENIVLVEKALPYINQKIKAFGIAPVSTFGDAVAFNYDDMKGKIAYALCGSTVEEQKNEAGEVIMDPFTGKPHTRVKHVIYEWADKYTANQNGANIG